jgi:integrase
MRQPKPFFRRFTKTWYVTIGGKQISLGSDEQQAFEQYHEIMAGRGRSQTVFPSVAHLFDAYLTWLQKNRSQGTYAKALHDLTLFAKHLGSGFAISKLVPIHVTQWLELHDGWSPSTGNDAVSIIQRAFTWAVNRGHVAHSPISAVEGKPSRARREIVFTDDQWTELRSNGADQEFGDLLDFMWDTGCRPLEARTIRADHIDLKNTMIVFPPSQAKGKRNERVIFLPEKALAICKRLVAAHPKGPIFRNTHGRPWTKDSINCRFQRLRQKLKRPLCAYAIRHSYAAGGLKRGMDSLTLAQIMGHSDTTMLSKHYAHLARNPNYLRQQAQKDRA